MKTPAQLVERGMPALLPSRRILHAHEAFISQPGGISKPAYLATMYTLEASGALAQIGDPAANVDRIRQKDLAKMSGITRGTVTVRMSKIAEPDEYWTEERKQKRSAEMKRTAAMHPHWKRDKRSSQAPSPGLAQEPRTGEEGTSPGSGPAITPSAPCNIQRPVILKRNRGWGAVPNLYTLAMPDAARPGLKAEADKQLHAFIMASHFGHDVFYAEAKVNGWTTSWGWNWHADLPDAPDCECRKQKSFDFQKTCPRCEGQGYVIGGSMPDYGRVLLHWLKRHGIDEEIRRCHGCKRSYSQAQAKAWPNCPGCQTPGQVYKARGILTGWTQKEIAKDLDMSVSTVRHYFKVFSRLGLVRWSYGTVWRNCCGKLYSEDACPKCGNKAGAFHHREPWKIHWLPCRTLDRDLAKAERERIDGIVRVHKHFLEAQHQRMLESAAQLALTVLRDWTGKEHQLCAFANEMRRRLNTAEHARCIKALFPLNSS